MSTCAPTTRSGPVVIFDFDGVVADSEPMHEAALRQAVRELGMDLNHEQNVSAYLGCDDRDAYALIARDNGRTPDPREYERLATLKWEAARRAIDRGDVRLFEHTVAMAREAKDRGVPIAICSGARRHEIDYILSVNGLTELFPVVVSADDVARSKPDPACYQMTLGRLNAAPARAVAIEDTDRGIAAARGAGMAVVGVGHSLPVQRLREATLVVEGTHAICLDTVLELVSRGA
ncbi:MAG: HAD family phosphatase [Phycisphaeraceae bacterium]|nr:HAD family phosphatase [Phycisphaeraceae bacterium]